MDEFIKKIILRETIITAFQRRNVYKSSFEKISDENKKSLKKTIKEKLEKIRQNYTNTVLEEDHG